MATGSQTGNRRQREIASQQRRQMHPLAVDLEPVDISLGPSVTDGVEDHRARVAELA
jgi:hypothetical protein